MQKVRNLIFLLMFCIFSIYASANNYRYINTFDGLSSRRVYSIVQGRYGYVWFLTYSGIDRYDGRKFTNYKSTHKKRSLESYLNTDYLDTDNLDNLFYISQSGDIYEYDESIDDFSLLFNQYIKDSISGQRSLIENVYLDKDCFFLITDESSHYIFDYESRNLVKLNGDYIEDINTICSVASNLYYICSSDYIYKVQIKNQALKVLSKKDISSYSISPYSTYYHKEKKLLVIGTNRKGLYFYYPQSDSLEQYKNDWVSDSKIVDIMRFDDSNLLIATDAAGVYQLDINTMCSVPYAVDDYQSSNKMNSNVINAIFVDDDKRVWIANFPGGITLVDSRLPSYDWIKHYNGNIESLVNDNVNRIMEDCDGDLWFATNNGLSLYKRSSKKWNSILSSFNFHDNYNNLVFLALCEVEPEIVWAAGYSSSVYRIDKRNMSVEEVNFSDFEGFSMSNKYVNTLYKSKSGYVWSGGLYNLKRLEIRKKRSQICADIKEVNCIVEYDDKNILVGTNTGVYLVNEETLDARELDIKENRFSVLGLLRKGNKLFIGTEGDGLIVYDIDLQKSFVYNKDNSALFTNNIYTIVDCSDDYIILTSENRIIKFDINSGSIYNWGRDMGLLSDGFNVSSGIRSSDGKIFLGTIDGVIAFMDDIEIPDFDVTPIILEKIDIQGGDKYVDCLNGKTINDVNSIDLNYKQNDFALSVTTVDFDSPSNTIFKWRLEGYETTWKESNRSFTMHYSDIHPGNYRLVIQTYQNGKNRLIEERILDINIKPPFWKTVWAYIAYVVLVIFVFYAFVRLYLLNKSKAETNEKISFYTNTAHDIRTPLTLIKTPIDDIVNRGDIDSDTKKKLSIAVKGVNSLLGIVNNLIDFEKESKYSDLDLKQHNLDGIILSVIDQYVGYAKERNIELVFNSSTRGLEVFVDKTKIESILKNLVGNSVKYTLDGGKITVSSYTDKKYWNISVKDTGIGIAKKEVKRLFNKYFRGSNAVNAKISGSGMGLLFVKTLVKKHRGHISVESELNKGTEFVVSVPMSINGKKAFVRDNVRKDVIQDIISDINEVGRTFTVPDFGAQSGNSKRETIMIVEDNDQLRDYLVDSLSDKYNVDSAANGFEAWEKLHVVNPDLIVSDVMMPEMDGNELCRKIKSEISTSHIPVILLTALNDNDSLLKGLDTGADKYLTKPFDMKVLLLTIKNLLYTRNAFKQFINGFVGHIDVDDNNLTEQENQAGITSIDRDFLSKVKEYIMRNIDNSDYTIDSLCADVSMSRTSFYNKLKGLTGETPQDYVKNIRLNYAASLIVKGEKSITEIAYMTGFRDAKYFREVFKKQFGVAPSQYTK